MAFLRFQIYKNSSPHNTNLLVFIIRQTKSDSQIYIKHFCIAAVVNENYKNSTLKNTSPSTLLPSTTSTTEAGHEVTGAGLLDNQGLQQQQQREGLQHHLDNRP